MSPAEIKLACQQLLAEVRRAFPPEPAPPVNDGSLERPRLTLIQGAETNEERSERLGFNYTDDHRVIEETLDRLWGGDDVA